MQVRDYRPRFVGWISFLTQLPIHLFMTVWSGGFIGGITGIGPKPVGIAFFVLFPIVNMTVKALNYRNTTYHVGADKIVIEEGFLTQQRKEIRISSIRELSLRRGVLQRSASLGTVYVATQATGDGQRWSPWAIFGANSSFGSGAMLLDLPDYAEAYEMVRQHVDAAATELHQLP